MRISNLWLIESMLRHRCPLSGMELLQKCAGFVIPGGRQVVFAVQGIRNRFRQGFVKVAHDVQVIPAVMQEGFDGKACAFGLRSKLLAQQSNEALAFGPGAGQIVFLTHTDTVFLNGCRSEHQVVFHRLLR